MSESPDDLADATLPLSVAAPTLTLKDPIPEDLAALGREVLELVPRKQRGSLDAYRQAANGLSAILKATGVLVKPKVLYYTALRVKWIANNTTSEEHNPGPMLGRVKGHPDPEDPREDCSRRHCCAYRN
jgi:hypothetical protein